jgi:hypothetical protein
VLLAVTILSLVASIVRPNFFAITMLLVFEPITFVSCPISVVILSETVCFVILPFTVVNIAVSVDQTTPTIRFVSSPVTFVEGAIDPDLDSTTVFTTELILLALVLRTIIESHLRSLNANDIIRGRARFEFEGFK